MIKQKIIIAMLLAFLLISCGPADCSLQLVAGGSDYCEEATE